jgi:hypothetical protein
MSKGAGLWTMFLVLGVLLWLASVGVWSHPVYLLALMVVSLSWFSYAASAPKSN